MFDINGISHWSQAAPKKFHLGGLAGNKETKLTRTLPEYNAKCPIIRHCCAYTQKDKIDVMFGD